MGEQKEKALEKMARYCVYQERSEQEVIDKLKSHGLSPSQTEKITQVLVKQRFLNEERFVKAYISGKFRVKNWGKLKIQQGLLQKGIDRLLITQALNEIDPTEYINTLNQVLQKKSGLLKESDRVKKTQKLVSYALSKGFERDLISNEIKKIDTNVC